jgi:hypothetical protein
MENELEKGIKGTEKIKIDEALRIAPPERNYITLTDLKEMEQAGILLTEKPIRFEKETTVWRKIQKRI